MAERSSLAVTQPKSVTILTGSSAARNSVGSSGSTTRWRLVRRWRGGYSILLIIFALFWDAIAIQVTVEALSLGADSLPRALLVSTALLAVGLSLSYTGSAFALNSTSIDLVGDDVSIRRGPIPFPGGPGLSLSRTEIVKIRFEQCGHVQYRPRYKVLLDTIKPGDPLKVDAWLLRDEAQYIASTLAERLDLVG